MSADKGSGNVKGFARRFLRSITIQITISIKASLAVVVLFGFYDIWRYRETFVSEPLQFTYHLITASWVIIPALAFSLIFTIGIPISSIFISGRKWQAILVILYQSLWLLLGIVSTFFWQMQEPSLEANVGAMMIMILCIFLIAIWGFGKRQD